MLDKFPNLLNFPPAVQYFVDGSTGSADVFIDTIQSGGTVSPSNRTWKTVLVGGLRQGGKYYYALDVTQPDKVDATGQKTAALDSAPDCLEGTGGCPAKYPTVLWELTDNCSLQPVTCVANPPTMGETWSRPVVGRIQVLNAGTPEDRYVAIFGGGNDPGFTTGVLVNPATDTVGRAIYIVNVETGRILYKVTQGVDDAATPWNFAPMPAGAAVADYNDDGYLDVVYIGDVNGRMWKLDITPDSASSRGACSSCGSATETLTGYQPFLLYDASQSCTQCNEPIFLQAGIIFVAGGAPPTLGVAFGTGDRSNLLLVPNPSVQRFLYVVDSGAGITYHEGNLRNITPTGGVTPQGVGPGPYTADCATLPCSGFYLDFATQNEKSVTSVLSTQGFLTLLTFTPDSTSSCGTTGSSYQYRFFFINGQGGYNIGTPTGDYSDYRQSRGSGMAQMGESMSSSGDIHEIVLGSGGNLTQTTYSATQKTTTTNWKEVNQ